MTRPDRKKLDPTRSWVAVAANFRSGAGSHGGGKKEKNRRDRREAKKNLRKDPNDA